MFEKVLKHYGKDFNNKISKVTNVLGNGCWLPNLKEAGDLIECLQYYVLQFNQEEIDKINNDLSMVNNGYGNDLYYLKNKKIKIPKTKNIIRSPGYIYFLQDDKRRIKIGKTKRITKRIFEISSKLPFPIKLIHSFYTEDYTNKEKEIHQKYKQYRIRGEWFLLPKKEINFIKSL